jgi:hypothetical protein
MCYQSITLITLNLANSTQPSLLLLFSLSLLKLLCRLWLPPATS